MAVARTSTACRRQQFLPTVAKRESGGNPTAKNYVWEADPTAYERGATASGKYQMVNSTWRTAATAAGIDVSKYPTARDAPEALQDQAASKLYDMQGTSPWNKSKWGKDWVKGEGGKYTLQPTGGGGGGTITTAAAPPGASTTPPAAPAIQEGGQPPAPPGGPAGAPGAPYAGGGIGAQLNKPVVRGSPVPAGVLQSTGKPPGVASADQVSPVVAAIEEGRAGARATPDVPGAVLAAGPAAGAPPAVVPAAVPASEAGWGSKPGSYGEGPAAAVAPTGKPPATTTTPPVPGAPETKPAPVYTVDTSKPFTFNPDANPPPQWMLDRSNPTPTKAEASEGTSIERGYTAARRAAEASGDPGKIADVEKDFTQRRHDLQTRIDARVKEGNDAVRQQQQDAFNQQRDIYKENVNAQQTRLTNREQVDNEQRKGVYTALNTESLAINDRLASLNNLREMSHQIGPGTALSDQQVDFLVKMGVGSSDFVKRMGSIQAFRSAANIAVKDLRSGLAMGGMSDRDLTFIENMIPNARQSPYTRELIIGMISRGQERKQQMLTDIQTRMAGGTAPTQAIQEARKNAPPLFAQAPDDLDNKTAQERADWFRDNMTPGTLYRRGGKNKGAVDIYWGPDGPPPGYEREF